MAGRGEWRLVRRRLQFKRLQHAVRRTWRISLAQPHEAHFVVDVGDREGMAALLDRSLADLKTEDLKEGCRACGYQTHTRAFDRVHFDSAAASWTLTHAMRTHVDLRCSPATRQR